MRSCRRISPTADVGGVKGANTRFRHAAARWYACRRRGRVVAGRRSAASPSIRSARCGRSARRVRWPVASGTASGSPRCPRCERPPSRSRRSSCWTAVSGGGGVGGSVATGGQRPSARCAWRSSSNDARRYAAARRAGRVNWLTPALTPARTPKNATATRPARVLVASKAARPELARPPSMAALPRSMCQRFA